MTVFNDIVIASWVVFIFYWVISASNVRRDIGPGERWKGRLYSVARIAIVALLAYLYPGGVRRIFCTLITASRGLPMNVAGVSLSVSGVAFAIWARRHLGTNWSLNPSLKEDHQLVTSGPYRFLRHPIYTGMLTGLLGSLLATFSPVWFYLLIVMIVTFIYRVHVEDNMMMQTFPEAYAAYKKKTKALIPFVW